MTRPVPPDIRPQQPPVPLLLLQAAHGGPALAVTLVAALLAADRGLPLTTLVAVIAAVLAGQLTIGWGNDLRDAARDRVVGRPDKPLATGLLTTTLVARCLAVAAVACLALSLIAGWRSAAAHLAVVGSGHAYNLVAKATVLSWLPYAVAFGSLPAVAWLAGPDPSSPPLWMAGAGAALGVGAHFLNALPDLDDDERTGVRGLPHRLGPTGSRWAATLLLGGATLAAALGPAGAEPAAVPTATWVVVALVGGLAVVALTGSGRAPFRAAVGIALADVALLVVG